MNSISKTEMNMIEQVSLNFMEACTIEDIEGMESHLIDNDINEIDVINKNDGFDEGIVNGMYFRLIRFPKGTFATGSVHLGDFVDIMISGRMIIRNFHANGVLEEPEEHEGLKVFNGMKGRKRVGLACEDTCWVTVDRTKVSELNEALKDIAVSGMKDFNRILETKK